MEFVIVGLVAIFKVSVLAGIVYLIWRLGFKQGKKSIQK